MKVLVSIVLLGVWLPTSMVAQDCIDYGDYMQCLGDVEVEYGYDLSVSGNFAYVADAVGLRVVDFSNSTGAEIIGELGVECYGIAVVGSYAYLTNFGLTVVDVSNPANPEILGSTSFPSGPGAVAVSGNYAYVASFSGPGNLTVVDITDSGNPQMVGSVETPGNASDVEISGNHAFVADGGFGLQVIDVTDPADPYIVGSVETPAVARGVFVSGIYAYVAASESGIQEVNISDPDNPRIVRSLPTEGLACDVVLAGDFIHAATGYSSLEIFDISNPLSPTVPHFVFPMPGGGNEGRVALSGDFVAVINRCDNMFCSCILSVLDVGKPMELPVVGRMETPGDVRELEIAGDYAFLADGEPGLQVVDISIIENPQIIGGVDTPGYAHGVDVMDGYAFVADGEWGLQVIDITCPGSPQLSGSLDIPGNSFSVVAANGYVFVVSSPFGLYVIDIADPEIPEILGFLELSDSDFCGPGNVEVVGGFAYVFDCNGLNVVDIADPENPQIVGSVHPPRLVTGITVSGSYAYTCYFTFFGYGSGFYSFDISDPANPFLAGDVSFSGVGYVSIAGEYAYVSGSKVIDISDPPNPRLIANCMTSPGGLKYTMVDGCLLATAAEDGLLILPVQCPTLASIVVDPGSDIQVPGSALRLAAHPNPFNPRTTLFFTLERDQSVAIDVFDMHGARVRVLAAAPYRAGGHSIVWNGLDDSGREVPSGSYIVRLKTEQDVQAKKVMLVR